MRNKSCRFSIQPRYKLYCINHNVYGPFWFPALSLSMQCEQIKCRSTCSGVFGMVGLMANMFLGSPNPDIPTCVARGIFKDETTFIELKNVESPPLPHPTRIYFSIRHCACSCHIIMLSVPPDCELIMWVFLALIQIQLP